MGLPAQLPQALFSLGVSLTAGRERRSKGKAPKSGRERGGRTWEEGLEVTLGSRGTPKTGAPGAAKAQVVSGGGKARRRIRAHRGPETPHG